MKQINDELTYKVIKCAMKVHNSLGNGFPSAAKGLPTARQEVIYQRCLAIELEKQGVQFLERKRCQFTMKIKSWGKTSRFYTGE